MHLPAKDSIPTPALALAAEGDQPTNFEVVKADFRYPLLARWTISSPAPAAHLAAAAENAPAAPPAAQPAPREVSAVATHFIAQLKPEHLPKVFELLGRRDWQVRQLSTPGLYRIGPNTSGPDFQATAEAVELLPQIRGLQAELGDDAVVEPDYLYYVSGKKPNDEDFNLQDALKTISAPEFWEEQTGKQEVRVAIIDTGVDLTHPDLYENLVQGFDFYNGQPNADDDHGHGTGCAGLVGAVGNNGVGIAGVNWQVSIIPIKAFSPNGIATASHVTMAVDFARKQKADVILCAWGSSARSQCLEAAIQRAHEAGILVVAAAGNSPLNLDVEDHFPATFNLPNIIAVGGSDDNDQPVKDWGHGERRVHLSAPGVQVYSTAPTRFRPYLPYDRSNGTSPAAALVAGACALLKAQYPQDSHTQIRDRLLAAGAKKREFAGASAAGRLDLANVVQPIAAAAPPPAVRNPIPPAGPDAGSAQP